MKRIYRRRLLKLAKFLETTTNNFDFNVYRLELECGTVACAIGWCPEVFPESWTSLRTQTVALPMLKNAESYAPSTSGKEFFGVDDFEYTTLFVPYLPNDQRYGAYGVVRLPHDATAKQVAKNIRVFVASKELAEARAIEV